MFQLSLSTILTSPTTPGAGLIPALSGDFSAALAGAAGASAISVPGAGTAIAPRQDGADNGKFLPTAPAETSAAADPELAWLGEPALPSAAPMRLAALGSAAMAVSADANPTLAQPAAPALAAEIARRGLQPARDAEPTPAMPHMVPAAPVAVTITTPPSAPSAQPSLPTGDDDAASVSTMPAAVSVIAAAPARQANGAMSPAPAGTATVLQANPVPRTVTAPQSPIQIAAAPARRVGANTVWSERSQDAAPNAPLPAVLAAEAPRPNSVPAETAMPSGSPIVAPRRDDAAAIDPDATVIKHKDAEAKDGSDRKPAATPADAAPQSSVFAIALPAMPAVDPLVIAAPELRPSVAAGVRPAAAPATAPAGPFPPAVTDTSGAAPLTPDVVKAQPTPSHPLAPDAPPPSYSAHEANAPSRAEAAGILPESPTSDATRPPQAAPSPNTRPIADLSTVRGDTAAATLTAPASSSAAAPASPPPATAAPRVVGSASTAAPIQLEQTAAAPDRPAAPPPAPMPLQPSAQPAANAASTPPAAVQPTHEAIAGAPQPPITRLAAEIATKADLSPSASPSPPAPARAAPAPQPAQPAAVVLGVAFGGAAAGQRPFGSDRPSPREQALQALTALGGSAHAAPIAAIAHAQHGALDMQRQDWPQAMIDRIEALRDAADATSTRITLAPDALGKVDLSIRHDGDAVHVHFSADAAQTRAILADAQPKLAELAQQRGFRLGQATVDAGTNGSGQRQQPHFAAPAPQRPASAFTATAAEEAAPDSLRLA
jgi:Meckel syndrome type 1 protein